MSTIRRWAGHDAAIAQRETEIQKLERLVWDAIYALQKAGLDVEAARLRRAVQRKWIGSAARSKRRRTIADLGGSEQIQAKTSPRPFRGGQSPGKIRKACNSHVASNLSHPCGGSYAFYSPQVRPVRPPSVQSGSTVKFTVLHESVKKSGGAPG